MTDLSPKEDERRNVEHAVRKSEDRFRRVVESALSAMVMVAPSGTIEMVNTQAERLFGYSRDELLGRSVEILVPERVRDGHAGLRRSFFADPRARPMGAGRDLFARRKDGSEFPVEIGLNPIDTDEGTMVLSAIVDITERRAAEAQRLRAERRIQELQSELLHVSRLSTMGQMASTLAHELNQPLTAVINYLQGLRRLLTVANPDSDRVVEIVDRAVAQTARAAQVIRRLREFVAKGETERGIEDLNRVVDEGVALGLVGAKESGVSVAMRLDDTLAPVFIDKIQVQQVVLNLVRNAVEAMEHSERRELVVSTQTGDRSTVELRIADSGPGIPPEIAARLFEPFLTTKKTGMGLGLSICREIVEAQGGRISAAADPATGGAVFSVVLPVAEGEKDEAQSTAASRG